mmetsp:Transcript_26095/g.65592  ORF Transcript_26095/g.65592 Transcript_26095/m.65592 type:complete len:201 (+) Transcript_26095:1164-1766(+)
MFGPMILSPVAMDKEYSLLGPFRTATKAVHRPGSVMATAIWPVTPPVVGSTVVTVPTNRPPARTAGGRTQTPKHSPTARVAVRTRGWETSTAIAAARTSSVRWTPATAAWKSCTSQCTGFSCPSEAPRSLPPRCLRCAPLSRPPIWTRRTTQPVPHPPRWSRVSRTSMAICRSLRKSLWKWTRCTCWVTSCCPAWSRLSS